MKKYLLSSLGILKANLQSENSTTEHTYKSPLIFHKVKSPNLFRSLRTKIYHMIRDQLSITAEEQTQLYDNVRRVILSAWESVAHRIDDVDWRNIRSIMVGIGMMLLSFVKCILKLVQVLVWSPRVHNLATSRFKIL
jgi:hypothetical protein